MSFRIGVVSLLIALFVFQAYGKSVKQAKHVKASKKQMGCGGGCPQQCAPSCQQSCCGQGAQGQVISHLTTVHHHHVHHMAPAPPAPPPAPLPPPPPPQTFHTQQHVFECDQPPCPQPQPQPPAQGSCATPPCGGGVQMPQQPCGAPPCGK